jgi:hypothetical protein
VPFAKIDVDRAIEFWKLALPTEFGLAVATNRDRRWFLNLLEEARRTHLGTEEAYEFKILVPEQPEDEVWLVRRDNGEAKG